MPARRSQARLVHGQANTFSAALVIVNPAIAIGHPRGNCAVWQGVTDAEHYMLNRIWRVDVGQVSPPIVSPRGDRRAWTPASQLRWATGGCAPLWEAAADFTETHLFRFAPNLLLQLTAYNVMTTLAELAASRVRSVVS